ncbi:MAG: hypothetical protein JXM71_09335, partial [Spirochaetales bacterium]|nr:hypothetical protein [Spirochaetales bacterium]
MQLTNQRSSTGRRAPVKARPLDIVVILMTTAIVLALAVSVYGGPPPAYLVISTDAGEWMYPLAENRVVPVQGKIGVSMVSIRDGAA